MAASTQVLVIGATGAQGGAVSKALLANGVAVRALVRDPQAPTALALAQAGAVLVQGDLDDRTSLAAAAEGADGLFSVQMAPGGDPDSERNQGRLLIEAARGAAVRQVVHTSVSGAAHYRSSFGWADDRWDLNYWDSKRDVEDMVREAGFPSHTILRPAFMMENFAHPKAARMFPDLPQHRIVTAVEPGTQVSLVAAQDIAAAAAAAFADPAKFQGAEIELAGDLLSFPQIARALSLAAEIQIIADTVSGAEAARRGQYPGWVNVQEWMNAAGYPARPHHMAAFDLRPTRLAEWATANRQNLDLKRERHGQPVRSS